MTPQELKNSILQLAIQGKLVEQRPEEGTGEALYQQIQKEKQALIKVGKIKKEKPLPEITEDKIPFEIPESWVWLRISNIWQVLNGDRGKNYPAKSTLSNKGIPFISALNLNNNTVVDDDNLLCLSESQYEKLGNGKLLQNDIVVCIRGSLGKHGRFPFEKGAIASSLVIMRSNLCNQIIDDYLMLYLETPLFYKEIKQYDNGTAQPNLAAKSLEQFLIPLPPLAEQKRIVAKIEELLPYIDRYEKAWTHLEDFNKRFPADMQKSILQLAIQGKLVEQRPEEGTGEELYRQIQKEKQALIKAGKIKKEKPLPEITDDEIPFDIPESWKWVSIGNVCINIQYGTSSKSSISGKLAVLRMGNIQNGRIIYDKLVYTSDETEIAKYPLEVNDLLFNRTNSKELVGKTAIYKGEKPAIYAGYLVRLTPLLMDSDFLNYVMQTQYYWAYCQTVRSDAIGQSNINAEKLKRFSFPLPPLAEQKRIVAKLEELLPLCAELK